MSTQEGAPESGAGQQGGQAGEQPPSPPQQQAPPPKGEDGGGDGSKDKVLQDLAGERRRRQDAERVATEHRNKVQALLDELDGKKTVEKTLEAETGRADTLEGVLLRYRVAAKTGLSLDMAERLIGTDEETLTEDAERLADMLRPANGSNGYRRDAQRTPPNGDRADGFSKEQLLRIMTKRE